MAEGQGNPSRGSGASRQGVSMSVCPRCRSPVGFTAPEKEELLAKRWLVKRCKTCSNYVRADLTGDNRVAISTPGQQDGRHLSEQDFADMASGANHPPSGKPTETGRSPGGNGPQAEPSRPPLPPPLDDRRPETLSPLQQVNLAVNDVRTTLANLLEQVTSVQKTVLGNIQVRLDPESWKLIQQTGAACAGLLKQFDAIAQRGEEAVAKTERSTEAACARLAKQFEEITEKAAARIQQLFDKETAERFANSLLTELLAPKRLWAGLNVYREWVFDQRCGEEPKELDGKRLKIIEHLPGLFKILEDALAQWTPPEGSTPPPPERQGILDELKKVETRIRDWLSSAAGLVFFPKEGDPFDIAQHDLHSSVVTDDPNLADTIKEVSRTGYRLGSDGPILRRAEVIRWVKARATASQEPPSQGS